MSSVLTSPPSSSSSSSSGDSTALSLAAASPVCELWASSAITAKRLPLRRRQLPHGLQREREGLDRADDDLLAAGQRLRQLAALAAALALDRRPPRRSSARSRRCASCSCVSITLRSETTSTESNSFLSLGVVQIGQEVRGPGDGVGLARAGRVLDQVLAARPFVPAPPPAACAWRRAGGTAGR